MATGTRQLRGKSWTYAITIDSDEPDAKEGTGKGTEVTTMVSNPVFTDTFHGSFLNWVRQGVGREVAQRMGISDPPQVVTDIWSGTWRNGKKHGYMAYFNSEEDGWCDGEFIDGAYVEGSTTTSVITTDHGKRFYHGETRMGETGDDTILVVYHGKGMVRFTRVPDGWYTEYTGEFADGHPTGKGVFRRGIGTTSEALSGVWTVDPLLEDVERAEEALFQPSTIIGNRRFVPDAVTTATPAETVPE